MEQTFDVEEFREILDSAAEKSLSTNDSNHDTCPYRMYHRDISGNLELCRAHFLQNNLIISQDKCDIVGLRTKKTAMEPLQRAATLMNRTLYVLVSDSVSRMKVRHPHNLTPIDHNTTYETNIYKMAKIYTKSISQLFSRNYYGQFNVTPLAQKELDKNIKLILRLCRWENFENQEKAAKARATVNLPAYVLLLHLMDEAIIKTQLQKEALNSGKEYAMKVGEAMYSILEAAQLIHYTKNFNLAVRYKTKPENIFRVCMCELNYLDAKEFFTLPQ